MDLTTNDPVRWGKELIKTQDHDPLYTALWSWMVSEGDEGRIQRFMVSYWCCYSVGASWWISSAPNYEEFWLRMYTAAVNKAPSTDLGGPFGGQWPRAHERRHWRGQKAVDSVLWMRKNALTPESMVELLKKMRTLEEVKAAVKPWPQFGPWIAFKAADMLERILGVPINFPEDVTTLYRDPRKGAEMMRPMLGNLTPKGVTDLLLQEYRWIDAPPGGDRRVNIQEVETVLCKWKSARNGKYRIGDDIRSHRKELLDWEGQDLLAHYPLDPGINRG